MEDSSKGRGKMISTPKIIKEAEQENCSYICITECGVPKKIFTKKAAIWKLVDEFSGYLLTTQKVENDHFTTQVNMLINHLTPLF
ncbi:MAG: hypothetical protein ACOYL3_23185 [Desulfuromonadaceae bacterium]